MKSAVRKRKKKIGKQLNVSGKISMVCLNEWGHPKQRQRGACGGKRLTLSYSCVYMVIMKMMAAWEQPSGASSRKLVK